MKPAYNNIFQPVFVWLIFVAGALASCQKVIDVDVRNAEKKFVVEAIVNDQRGKSIVRLSTTKNVSESNEFPGVSGALVVVRDDAGNDYPFTETTPGNYTDTTFTGQTGKTYSLEVKIDGNTFTAQSTMPQKINLDTLYITDEVLFGESRKLANIAYRDPLGRGNFYRYIQYINDKKSKQIFTNSDDYTDGKYVDTKLWYIVDDDDDEDEKIKSGDTVSVEMQCIDDAVHKYWFSVYQSATGNSQSASPANPVTNISGGALGYFSAHTMQKRSVVTP